MIIDEIQIRVRYGETEGVSYKSMEENGIMLPVVSLNINYKKPAGYDDVINVKTQLKNRPSAKIEFEYEITNKNGKILTTASTILVFVDMKTGRPVKAPKYIMDLIDA